MVEVEPRKVNSALFYFHSADSNGEEISPYLYELTQKLPNTYIYAGDGFLQGKSGPFLCSDISYGSVMNRYWFAFPMKGMNKEDFVENIESVGAVLVSCGGYINAIVDGAAEKYQLPTSRIVLCGHQHGACVALSAAMIRRHDPFSYTILFDPFPWETYYLKNENNLPATKVICVNNKWIVNREKKMNPGFIVANAFRDYGIHAEEITLSAGSNVPDEHMFHIVAKIFDEVFRS